MVHMESWWFLYSSPKANSMKHIHLSLPLLLTLGLLAGCTYGQPAPPTPQLTLPTTSPTAAEARDSFQVRRGAVEDAAIFNGRVTLATTQDLFFGTSGRVRKVYVQSGDTVTEGQLIAELDVRGLTYDLESAQISVELAEQRLAAGEVQYRFDQMNRQLNLQREQLHMEQLKADPRTSPNEIALQEVAVRQAELALLQLEGGMGSSLQGQLDQARIALRKLELALADARIEAPAAGQVLIYDGLQAGKVIQAYTPLASLVDPDDIVVEASLVPADLERLYEGLAVTVRRPGLPDVAVRGVIETLPQPFGTGSGNSTVITLDETASWVRPGTGVEIVAVLGRADNVLWLPPTALQGFKDNYYVRLRDGSHLPVIVGIYSSDRVEIKSGVTEGEVVVN